MKEKLFYIAIFLILLANSFTAYSTYIKKGSNLGTNYLDSNLRVLVGSASNYKSLPKAAYFGNATTTYDSSYADGNDTVYQEVSTRGVSKVLMNISAVAPTATSTLFVRQMGSFDGTTYFDLATSTEDRIKATSTIAEGLLAIQYDPGTATTSKMIEFNTEGLLSTRFIMWSEGWTGHLDTGVQAYIQVQPIEYISR